MDEKELRRIAEKTRERYLLQTPGHAENLKLADLILSALNQAVEAEMEQCTKEAFDALIRYGCDAKLGEYVASAIRNRKQP